MTDATEGAPAPDFSMPASGGRTASLEALKGKPFLLYFYPKADTPGCTKQACGLQEALPALGKTGLAVIGVSPDPMKPIEKFAQTTRWPRPMVSGSRSRCMGRPTWAWNAPASWWPPMGGSPRSGAR